LISAEENAFRLRLYNPSVVMSRSTSTTTCLKRSKGRGVGTVLINRCHDNEEPYGALCYPKCRDGYHAVGCCLCGGGCSAEKKGQQKLCRRSTYGRGVGASRLGCDDNKEKDAGLCYKQCDNGFKGVGPVCWQECPSNLSHKCGAMCAASKKDCAEAISSIILAAAEIGIELSEGDVVQAAGETVKTLIEVTTAGFC
jgi:hypothetical protein